MNERRIKVRKTRSAAFIVSQWILVGVRTSWPLFHMFPIHDEQDRNLRLELFCPFKEFLCFVALDFYSR